MRYEIDFLPADKHKIFLQIDRITLGVHVQRHAQKGMKLIFAG